MAFKMNRPIIKGSALHKNTGNNSDDLRPNIGGNTLGIKDAGELNEWYTSNMDKDNFGYRTYEDFKKDWPNAHMQDGYATTMEGGPDYIQKVKPEKIIKLQPRQIKQIATSEMEGLKKVPPYELVKNNTEYFTIEKQGTATHTYPKGEDGKVLIRQKDKPGRKVWSGSQTEFQEKYG